MKTENTPETGICLPCRYVGAEGAWTPPVSTGLFVCEKPFLHTYIPTYIQEKSRNVTKPTVSVYLCSQMSAAFKAVIQSIDLFQTDL